MPYWVHNPRPVVSWQSTVVSKISRKAQITLLLIYWLLTTDYWLLTGFALLRFRSPLLTESLLISLPAGTKMFQFPAFYFITLCIHVMMTDFLNQPGFPIRISALRRIFAPTRSFSQLVTSFFVFRCQGIHPVLFLAWPRYFLVLVKCFFTFFFELEIS